MKTVMKNFIVGSMLLLSGAACADLEVVNFNSADAERALATPGDVESLITGAYNTWFNGVYSSSGPGAFLSNASFQHNAPWANFGMEHYGRLPRIAIMNDVAAPNYGNFTRVWYRSYRAIAALASGLQALNDPDIADALGANAVAMDRAYGKFVQALSHASVAQMYDRGFLMTEDTDISQPLDPMPYDELMTEALALFDEAISLSQAATFTLPYDWMNMDVTNQDLVRFAYSLKARFRANVARTPEERAAVTWSAVSSDVDKGIQETLMQYQDRRGGWGNYALYYGARPDWGMIQYFVHGMADQSGLFQEWVNLPLSEMQHQLPDGRDVLIITPDLRYPQGETIAEQRANPGVYYYISSEKEAGETWKRPDRGTWRWGWYKHGPRASNYRVSEVFDQPEIYIAEMRLLKAEALYRNGDLGGAAAIINETRVPAGLNPTDAAGTNTSCVPKLPNGQCGDLWEMLKWEKRMETAWTGLATAGWYWDGRGWGDLYKDTPLQFPVPCQELQVLQLLPCNTFGGPGGEMGSPGSTYNYPSEG